MSDHEVSKPEPTPDVDDVVGSAHAGLADAEAARTGTDETAAAAGSGSGDSAEPARDDASQAPDAPTAAGASAPDQVSPAQAGHDAVADGADTTGPATPAAGAAGTTAPATDGADAGTTTADAADSADAGDASTGVVAPERARPERTEDPDLAAFAEAEAAYPGTFGGTFTPPPPRHEPAAEPTAATTALPADDAHDTETTALAATAAYASTEASGAGGAGIVASEPTAATTVAPTEFAPPAQGPLPIFVQAPEPPRDRGNRAAAGGIGLIATICFAILYLGAALGMGLLTGDVRGENIVDELLENLRSFELWIPVAVFFLGFWLLGAVINRGRWGYWVVFGILVGAAAYGGHILGQLFAAPFWTLTAAENAELANSQLLAPLAIAAFVFGRELTIWFGAWVARSGARKTELNAEAQREYERILEAGPQLPD
ncbi:ABC transporter [Microbacterium resistens]|uniref:ABC transporter n=1 Tax=Microbacterium resistens TaxID=156977 RepID=UPI001E4FE641|nr:ABC transporter [Microbacterium resistens]